jgi:maltose O-acetyltransferase
VDYGVNITVGKAFYANFGCTLLDVAPISIGDNVKLGPGVKIFTAGHPLDPEERNSGLEWGKAIRIADNVWVGGGAILCPGVSIGEGSTIGAGSVVTKDVPAGVVAGGIPLKSFAACNPKFSRIAGGRKRVIGQYPSPQNDSTKRAEQGLAVPRGHR